MTTLKLGRRDRVAMITFVVIFLAFATISYLNHQLLFALLFGVVGCGMAVDAAVRIFSWISFDPQEPLLTIRKWPLQPVTIQPQACLKLDSGKFQKLTYLANNHKHTYTIIGPYEDEKAWSAYARKWLQSIKTSRTQKADELVTAIENSTSEDDFNRRYKSKSIK